MQQPDIGSVCRSHLEFMKWADEMVLAALLKVPADKAALNMGNSFGSMLDTLNHVYLAEQLWLKRVDGENVRLADLPAPSTPGALSQQWPELHQSWLSWVDAQGADDLSSPFTFRSSAGGDITMPSWQIVFHVVNHGTYHRGQFTTLLRQSGLTPSGTDLFTYYRTH